MEGDQIKLNVRGSQFVVNKEILCDHSDYFKAMFSGSFKEHNKKEFTIDFQFVDATSMGFIIEYMTVPSNLRSDFTEYPLTTICNLAAATNVLQVTQLAKIIERYLENQDITTENWFEMKATAEHMNYTKVKQSCLEFGLPCLKDMKPEYVPSIQELVWYLSQTHLYVTHEYDVFKFAMDWMAHSNINIDSSALLMFLGCLDFKRVVTKDLNEIKKLCLSLFSFLFLNIPAAKTIDCLIELSESNNITKTEIISKEATISEKYGTIVYNEVLRLVESSRSRKVKHVPLILVFEKTVGRKPRHRREFAGFNLDPYLQASSTTPQFFSSIFSLPDSSRHDYNAGYSLYKFTNRDLKKLLDLNIPKTSDPYYITWSIASWGPKNLVLVVSKGKKDKNQDGWANDLSKMKIAVYNVAKEVWDTDIELPPRMVRRLAVVNDSLYIICGYGDNLIYDLAKRTYKNIAKQPFKILEQPDIETRLPLICVYYGEVYLSESNVIYKYEEASDQWIKVIELNVSITNMVSHDDGYIYVTDISERCLSRFRPGEDKTIDIVTSIEADEASPIINSCSLGDRLLFFINKTLITDPEPGQPNIPDIIRTLSVKEYNPKSNDGFKEIWSCENTKLKFDPYRNACRVVFTVPTIDAETTEYLKECLKRYDDGPPS